MRSVDVRRLLYIVKRRVSQVVGLAIGMPIITPLYGVAIKRMLLMTDISIR